MGRICYFHAFSGMSGDMTVGALVDAGADPAAIVQTIESLGFGGSFEFAKVKRRGIGATKFRVTVADTKRHRHLPAIVKMIEASGAPLARKRARLLPSSIWAGRKPPCTKCRLRRCISMKSALPTP